MTNPRYDPPIESEWPPGFGGGIADWPDRTSELIDDRNIRIETFERDGQFIVRADLPGVDPDRDVTVTVLDHTMLLNAHRQGDHTHEAGATSELYHGPMSRVVGLPHGAGRPAEMQYIDGILEIRVPIADESADSPMLERPGLDTAA